MGGLGGVGEKGRDFTPLPLFGSLKHLERSPL